MKWIPKIGLPHCSITISMVPQIRGSLHGRLWGNLGDNRDGE